MATAPKKSSPKNAAGPTPPDAAPQTLAISTKPLRTATRARTSPTSRKPGDAEKNAAPSQWGRRLARLVGDKFGVSMSENFSKNEGVYRGKDIVIKCAKSTMPPVSVLVDMLDRIDLLWAVYIMDDNTAEVWAVDAKVVREIGYFTHGPNVQRRVELYLRKIIPAGKLVGTLTSDEVDSCHIP